MGANEEGEEVEIGGAVGTFKPATDAGEGEARDLNVGPIEQQRPKRQARKGERNIHGDFIVTKINIVEKEIVIPQNEDGEEEEESEEESEEEPPRQEPEEEEKKAPVK